MQEVRGCRADADLLQLRLQNTHVVHYVPPTEGGAGGLLFIVKLTLTARFVSHILEILLDARVALLRLHGDNSDLLFINLHIEPSMPSHNKQDLLARVLNICQPSLGHVVFVAGDFNFEEYGESCCNADKNTCSSHGADMARWWNANSSCLTELHQGQFTRCQRGAAGLIYSRIDRIYCNTTAWELSQYKTYTAAEGYRNSQTEPSDHIPVIAAVNRAHTDVGPRAIPVWVCKTDAFKNELHKLTDSCERHALSTHNLNRAKELFRSAANSVLTLQRYQPPTTNVEYAHWAATLLRTWKYRNEELALRAVHTYTKLQQYVVFDSNQTRITAVDTIVVNSLLCECMTETAEDQLEAVANSDAIPPMHKAQKRLAIETWAKQWSPRQKRTSLEAAKDERGQVVVNPDEAAQLFINYWGNTFKQKDIHAGYAKKFLKKYCRKLPLTNFIISLERFTEILEGTNDSATGPDGIPYAAWRVANQWTQGALHEHYLYWIAGNPVGESFNEAWLSLLPKGEADYDTHRTARAPDETRPLSCCNSDCKITALALNDPVANVLSDWADASQRGFVLGRCILDNFVELDTEARIAALDPALQPALLFFDFAAAFPSIAWAFLWMVLQAAGVPWNIIQAIRALHGNNKVTTDMAARPMLRLSLATVSSREARSPAVSLH